MGNQPSRRTTGDRHHHRIRLDRLPDVQLDPKTFRILHAANGEHPSPSPDPASLLQPAGRRIDQLAKPSGQ